MIQKSACINSIMHHPSIAELKENCLKGEYTLGVSMKNQAGYIVIAITMMAGICLTAVPASAQAYTSEEPNKKQSAVDSLKTYVFSLRNGLYNRFGRKSEIESKHTTTVEVYPYDDNENSPTKTQYNKQGEIIAQIEAVKDDSTSAPHSFWNKILTKANNAYNSLGQVFGFSTTGNKQGAVNTFTETSKENPTITPAKSIDYNAIGETIVNTETNIMPTSSPSSTSHQVKRSNQPAVIAPTPTRTPQTQRSLVPFLSPTSSPQRR